MASKPMLIYVKDPSEDTGEFDKIDKVILDDNKVLVGMWAFRCVKMTPSDVQNDPLLADEGKETPRFILVSRDYSDIKVIEGNKIKTKTLFDGMRKFAKKAYGVDLKKVYKQTMKVLNEFDKINTSRKNLKKPETDASKGDVKKYEKELAELDERQKKAEEERDKLLKFEPKDKA